MQERLKEPYRLLSKRISTRLRYHHWDGEALNKIIFDEFIIESTDEKSPSCQIKKNRDEFSIPIHEIFEAQTCISILSLLTNKLIVFSKYDKQNNETVFDVTINNGIFEEIVNIKPQLESLLHIDSSLFIPYICSAQRFYESITLDKQDASKYSMAFASLVYSIESLANVAYENRSWHKRERFVRFVENNVHSPRFSNGEIRQLEFTGRQKDTNLVFRELLNQSYMFRNDYVHAGKILSTLSRLADGLSMAFVSNDQVAVFPSHSWLRRVTNLALINFLNDQPHKGENHLSTYFEPYKSVEFKGRRTIQRGEMLDENAVYLQLLSDDFFSNRKRF